MKKTGGKKKTAGVLGLLLLLLLFAMAVIYQNRYSAPLDFARHRLLGGGEEAAPRNSPSAVTAYGGRVAAATKDGIVILDDRGGEVLKDSFPLTAPLIRAEEKYLIAADPETKEVRVYKDAKMAAKMVCDNGIITARVNRNGYFAVVTRRAGYNGEVAVYNPEGEKIYAYLLGENKVVDVDISADNTKAALSVIRGGEQALKGGIVFLDLGREEPIETKYTDGDVYACLDYNRDGSLIAVGGAKLDFYSAKRELKWSKSLDGAEPLCALTASPDAIALALSPLAGVLGARGEVRIFNRLGEQTGLFETKGKITALSRANDNIAVAYEKEIALIDRRGNLLKKAQTGDTVRQMAVFGHEKKVLVFCGGGTKILDLKG